MILAGSEVAPSTPHYTSKVSARL